jgi:Bacterial Ig-like domain (group 2)
MSPRDKFDFDHLQKLHENNLEMWAALDIARSLRELTVCVCDSAQSLAALRVILTPRLSAQLTIHIPHHHKGATMPATILVGSTATAVWQEFSGPNGTGDKLPAAGAVTFSSSDPAIATVDPSSGLITQVAMGTATISGTDAANSLTASDTVTGTETAQSATLTVVPN